MSQLYIESRLTTISDDYNSSDLILKSLLNYEYTNLSINTITIDASSNMQYNNIKGIKIIANDSNNLFDVFIDPTEIISVDSFELHSQYNFSVTIRNPSDEDSLSIKVIVYE